MSFRDSVVLTEILQGVHSPTHFQENFSHLVAILSCSDTVVPYANFKYKMRELVLDRQCGTV